MKKISEEECMELIKNKFPASIPYWEEDAIEFGSAQGITMQMILFGKFVMEIIKTNNEMEVKRIFDFVEFLLCHGDQDVQDATATGLLEYLLGKYPDELNFRPLVKYLGEESIGYCRAWDEFTGVKTDGLWDDVS